MKRIKAKANAMENADVAYISLVSRPASRIPFRITKSDDPVEGSLMFNLTRLFKQDGAASAPQGCTLAAVVLQAKHEAHFSPKLKELGLNVEDRVEEGDVVILKQGDFEHKDVSLIKLGEVGGLFWNLPESVCKQFEPFPESEDFDDNMHQAGFLPGMSIATDILMETVRNVLRTAADKDEAKGKLQSALSSYEKHLIGLVDELPTVAFKLDAMDLTGFEEATKAEGEEEAPAQEPDAEKQGPAEAGEAESDNGGDDGGNGAEVTKQEPQVSASDPNAGLTDAEKEIIKGVHIEDLDVEPTAAATAETESASADSTEEVEKSGESEPEFASILNAFKAEVLEAVSGIRNDLDGLKIKQVELTEQVEATTKVAAKAQQAVKGTVTSNSDGGDRVVDESLGTRRRAQRSEGDASEQLWGGTSLDRIVGDIN